MPKLNALTLSGFVFTKPKAVPVEPGSPYKLACCFDMSIEREMVNRFDILTVKTYDAVAEKALRLSKGDYIITENAVLKTTNYVRVIEHHCPQCLNVQQDELNSEKTEIILNTFVSIPRVRPQSCRGVNRIIALGNICTDINYYHERKTQAKFKLAIDRSGITSKYQHADYPFVISYNEEADYVHANYGVGGLVLVDGSVMQRNITQRYPCMCKECGEVFETEENNKVVEIAAWRIHAFKHAETRSIEEIKLREEEDKAISVEYPIDDLKIMVDIENDAKQEQNVYDTVPETLEDEAVEEIYEEELNENDETDEEPISSEEDYSDDELDIFQSLFGSIDDDD